MDSDRFFDNGFVAKGMTDFDIADNPDLKENRNLANKYEELMRQEGNQLDAKNKYRRSLVQTINLGIATLMLCVLIYKQ
jgi:hypothetical protein